MEKFKIKVSDSNKTINVKLRGCFKAKDGLNYLNEYTKIVHKINPKEYTLKFDCTKLALSARKALKVLKLCFYIYYKAKFKLITAVVQPSQSALSAQFNKLAKGARLNNFYVISYFYNNLINLKTPYNNFYSNNQYINSFSLLYLGYKIYYWIKRRFSIDYILSIS